MERKIKLVNGETYHIYNRGAHKQSIFTCEADYARFILLLFLSNSREPLLMRDILTKYRGRSSADIFLKEQPGKSLVDILSYCFMPNHFHLVLRQKVENGITKFMSRVSTAYSMYFNTKYKHSGTLFQGRFKSSHIGNEPYFRYIFSYIHLNPLDLFEQNWKERGVQDIKGARQHINTYPYSSFLDFSVTLRPERAILALDTAPDFLRTQNDLEVLLSSFTEDRPLQKEGVAEE